MPDYEVGDLVCRDRYCAKLFDGDEEINFEAVAIVRDIGEDTVTIQFVDPPTNCTLYSSANSAYVDENGKCPAYDTSTWDWSKVKIDSEMFDGPIIVVPYDKSNHIERADICQNCHDLIHPDNRSSPSEGSWSANAKEGLGEDASVCCGCLEQTHTKYYERFSVVGTINDEGYIDEFNDNLENNLLYDLVETHWDYDDEQLYSRKDEELIHLNSIWYTLGSVSYSEARWEQVVKAAEAAQYNRTETWYGHFIGTGFMSYRPPLQWPLRPSRRDYTDKKSYSGTPGHRTYNSAMYWYWFYMIDCIDRHAGAWLSKVLNRIIRRGPKDYKYPITPYVIEVLRKSPPYRDGIAKTLDKWVRKAFGWYESMVKRHDPYWEKAYPFLTDRRAGFTAYEHNDEVYVPVSDWQNLRTFGATVLQGSDYNYLFGPAGLDLTEHYVPYKEEVDEHDEAAGAASPTNELPL